MLALPFLLVYLCAGCAVVRFLLPRQRALNRLWLGLSLGLLLMMWLPALAAFALKFSLAAHLASLGLLGGVVLLAWLGRDRRAPLPWDDREKRRAATAMFFVLPLTALSACLQYTHVMRVAADGSWHVGQSTYGDLPMHLAFITGLENAPFPPEYPFYPGHRLSYPFLADSLSTSFYLMGFSLQAATTVPATLMMALCYLGVLVFAEDMTASRKAALLAALFFFLNGGLGFLYDFDQAAGFESDGTLTVRQRVLAILEGYYKTPTNQPDPNNLRWSNVIADLMVPQRTLLGGWCMAIPCFYLLFSVFRKDGEEQPLRTELLLAVWAGLLPLVHTHSFLALGLCSLGLMLYDCAARREERKRLFLRYLRYGLIAAALAVPQLFAFTFTQTFQAEGAEGAGVTFLQFQFNWVNNPGGRGMRDFYLWFYIKNIGLPFLLLLGALFERDPRMRRIEAGALPIVLAAEFIRFQPNEYDNNKLLYLAWLLLAMPAADYAGILWRRLKGLRARPVIAAAAAVVTFLSAGLTLWREVISDYQAFSPQSVEAAAFIRDETPEDSVFLTGTQHLNPVDSLAGRRIVCGPDLWLYYHGFNTSQRKADIAAFYADPEGCRDVLERYGVSYVYVSSYELHDYDVDEEALARLCEPVFENAGAAVWRVRSE